MTTDPFLWVWRSKSALNLSPGMYLHAIIITIMLAFQCVATRIGVRLGYRAVLEHVTNLRVASRDE